MCVAVPKMCGNELQNAGEAWIEQKWFLPMLSLSVKPKAALDWLYGMQRATRQTFQ